VKAEKGGSAGGHKKEVGEIWGRGSSGILLKNSAENFREAKGKKSKNLGEGKGTVNIDRPRG